MRANKRILIACEWTGVVRRAFADREFDAWPVDLRQAEDRNNRHIVGDARDHLRESWHLLIVAHPPCTRLCNSGVRWLHKAPRGRDVADLWIELG